MAQIEYSGKDNLEVMRGARRYNQYLVDLVLGYARQGDVIMDFGAGAGTFAAPVAVTGHRVVCIETDPDLCVVLRQQGLEVSDSIDAIADVSVDYIYSLNVLEHIDDDQAILAAWHRKLRPGGRITIYVPAFPSLYTSMDRKVGHVRRYTKQELIEKVSLAGFDVARARYADSLGYLATLLYKYSGKQDGSVDEAMLRLYDQYIFPVSRLIDCVAGAVIGKNLVVQAVKGAAKDAAAQYCNDCRLGCGYVLSALAQTSDRQRHPELLDGKLPLVTKTGTLEADVVEQYKNLADIERGFRVLKSDIETGPVYHRLLEQLRGIQHQAANCAIALPRPANREPIGT